MKFLIISYLYPPIWEAQSIRWYYISKSLAQLGHKVDVLTIKLNNKEEYENENLKIYRIYPGLFEFLLFKYKNKLGLESKYRKKIAKIFLLQILRKSYKFARKFINHFLLGDVRNEWFLNFLVYYYSNLRKKILNYDYIICAHEPMVDLFIGWFLKINHPRIKLIIDMADPLTADYYPIFWKSILSFLEKKILEKSELILVTNPFLKNFYIKNYSIEPKRLFVFTQGFDENLLYECKKEDYIDNNTLCLFYAGSFYSFRNPSKFFNVIKRLPNVKFFYAGRHENFLPAELVRQNKIVYLGVLPHQEVLKYAKRMHILVYFSNQTEYQIPGKIFEYLGLRKPIFCITPKKQDFVKNLIEEFKVGITATDEENDIEKKLLSILDLWKRKKDVSDLWKGDIDKIKMFSWQYQTKKFINYLKFLL